MIIMMMTDIPHPYCVCEDGDDDHNEMMSSIKVLDIQTTIK